MQSSPTPVRHDPEAGIVLLFVICMTVLLLLSLAVAAPKIATSIQRQKDLETIHRGEQYRRAIQLYYRQFGQYPTSIDQLVNTNNVRFLRKRYTDPLTGKDDWKPIYYGQAHVHPLGFFGKPLSAVGGLAGMASAVMGGASQGMYAIAPTSTTGTAGSSTTGSGTMGSGGLTGATDSGGSGLGSSSMGSAPSGGMSLGGQSAASTGIGSPMGTSGIGSSSPMGGTPGPGSSSSSPFGSSSSSFGTSATSFNGGGPIVGFTLPVKKPSLIDYMEQTAYNKWEFNYDPIVDQLQAVNLLGGGGTMDSSSSNSLGTSSNSLGSGTNSPGSGTNSFGGGTNSMGFGSSSPTSGPTSSPTSGPSTTGPGTSSPTTGFGGSPQQ